MFYEIKDTLKEINIDDINANELTVGFLTAEELALHGHKFNIDDDNIEESQKANPSFRTGVDVRENYTFSELKIVSSDGCDDNISIFIMKNLLLIVDIIDEDDSTRNSFLRALRRYPGSKLCSERLICYFIEGLLSDGNKIAENIRNELTDMEERIVNGTAESDFNAKLLGLKKRILKYYNFYCQILDISETLEENDNEIFAPDNLIYISNLTNKVSRLKDDINSMSSISDHIQDAYAVLLDQRMNNTMKIFTVITTIFFPLTIIVGWYGMNFVNMPELTWKYGYIYVIILSVIVVLLLTIVGKKKKWF